MIEILDPETLQTHIDNILEKIKEYSLLPEKRIGWNYCLDYVWLALQFEKCIEDVDVRALKIVDIGCGPGAVHGYLEDKYGVNIIGVDLNHWETGDYVDHVGDFSDLDFRQRNDLNDLDLIISTSAFEHNKPAGHALLVNQCLKSLSNTGVLITTFSVAPGPYIEKYKSSAQWNLPRKIIEEIYGDRISNFEQYKYIEKKWAAHKEMRIAFEKRFGKIDKNYPPFLSIGAAINKNMLKTQKIRQRYLGWPYAYR